MLDVASIAAGYGRAQILFDVSLNTAPGEVVVLLGRNGAGKSTTLKTLAGLVRARAGAIQFNGQRIEGCRPIGSPGWVWVTYPRSGAFSAS